MKQEQPPEFPNTSASQEYRIDAVRQLASGIAHEFANALTAIAGIAYFLQDELTLDRQSEEDLKEIRRITEDAAFLARELMAFASTTAGQLSRRPLSEIVKQLRRVLPHVLPPQIQVEERLAPNDIVAWADPQQTIELALALAAHARRVLSQGGELIIQTDSMKVDHDATDTVPPGVYAVLEIAASSGEAPPRTGRTDERQLIESLAEAAAALKRSGGALSIQQALTGTTRLKFDVLTARGRVGSGIETPPDSKRASGTVLLVEDDEDLADVVARMLQIRGTGLYAPAMAMPHCRHPERSEVPDLQPRTRAP